MGVTEPYGSPSPGLELCTKGPGGEHTQQKGLCPVPRHCPVSQADTSHRMYTHLDHVFDAAVGMLFNHRLDPYQGLDLPGRVEMALISVVLQSPVSQTEAEARGDRPFAQV